MTTLLPSLGQLLLILIIPAALALLALRFFPLPQRVAMVIFPLGTLGVPLFITALGAATAIPAAVTFTTALIGIYAVTLAFPLLAARARRRHGDERALVRNSVLYLLSSILWFALIYWSGSSADIEGLHFAVMPLGVGLSDPPCITIPELICNHLSFVEALHLSAGNLLTVGAAGITPLDEFTRALALLQMVPVFVAAFLLARN
jgi:hypothetical protein